MGGTRANAYCTAVPPDIKCQAWAPGMGGSLDHKAIEGAGEGPGRWALDLLLFRITSLGEGKICLTQGHTCHHHATLDHTSLEMFILFLVQIPAGKECTPKAGVSVKGPKCVDPARDSWPQKARHEVMTGWGGDTVPAQHSRESSSDCLVLPLPGPKEEEGV